MNAFEECASFGLLHREMNTLDGIIISNWIFRESAVLRRERGVPIFDTPLTEAERAEVRERLLASNLQVRRLTRSREFAE